VRIIGVEYQSDTGTTSEHEKEEEKIEKLKLDEKWKSALSKSETIVGISMFTFT
jgi:hypothetical protein